ncbi:hypothetical protein ACHAXT_004468 [Thalassiosira profunda]
MVEQSGDEYGRPRRPTPATMSYLDGLPLDEAEATRQAREYVAHFRNKTDSTNGGDAAEDAPEYPQMIGAAHAALSSIFHELASLACEEIPSQQVETLIRIVCRYSLVGKRVVMAGLGSYWVFLSTHRFGSHVAQTALRCAVAECEVNLDEFDDGQEKWESKMVIEDSYESLLDADGSGGGSVPNSLSDLLVQTVEELKPFASELAVHVCGSHVLRSALCIVSGVEFVEAFPHPGVAVDPTNGPPSEWDAGALAATRRGKAKDKKKKKKKRAAVDEGGSGAPQVVTVAKGMKVVPELQSDDFKEICDGLMNEMVGILTFSGGTEGDKVSPPGELQQWSCHPSAGPLLVQLVRILSYRDDSSQSTSKKRKREKEITPDRRLGIHPREPTYSEGSAAESVVHRLLCWDSTIAADGQGGVESGDASKEQPYAGDVIYGLSGEPRGSILLEAILRCCPDAFHDALCRVGGFYDEKTLREYIQHGVSNYVVQAILVTVRNREQVSTMVKCLNGIVEDGSILPGSGRQETEDDNAKPRNARTGIVWRACEMCASTGSSQDQEQILSALLRGFASLAKEKGGEDDTKSDDKLRKKRSKAKGLSVEECIPRLLGLEPGSCEGGGKFAADGSRITLDAAGARALYHILHFKERLRMDWVKGIVNMYGSEDLVKIANDGLGSRCVLDGLLEGPSKAIASKLLVPKLMDRLPFLATERVGHHTVEKLFKALPTFEDKAAISAELSHSLNRLGSNKMGRSVMTTLAVKEYLEGESAWKDALAKQREKDGWLDEILGTKEGSDDEEGEPTTKKRKKSKRKEKKSKKLKRKE